MNNTEEINIGDKIEFTEDSWNTYYKGKVINKRISPLGEFFYVFGSKYGHANVGINSIRKLK